MPDLTMPDLAIQPVRMTTNTPPSPARTSETAAQFEAMMLRPMVEAMVPRGGAMGEGMGADAWRSMMVDALSAEIARSGALGLDGLVPDLPAPGGAR